MKLASVGIDPDHVGFAADYVSIHDSTELLNISFHLLFYYLILETSGFFFTVQHRKLNRHRYRTPLHRIYGHTVRGGGGGDFKSIFGSGFLKLEANGLDLGSVGFIVAHVSVELSGSIIKEVGFQIMVERNLDLNVQLRAGF